MNLLSIKSAGDSANAQDGPSGAPSSSEYPLRRSLYLDGDPQTMSVWPWTGSADYVDFGTDAGANPGVAAFVNDNPFAGSASSAATTIASTADSATSVATLMNPLAGTFVASTTDSAIGSQGATAAQLQQALDESGLSVNGSGIKVGVLSDSFNNLGGAAADEADGALPPASDIQVLKDLSSGGTDEGRAMMQIVHDIAPGASLAFYTAFDSEQDFANGILALAADGCKVICDDVSYFDEPFFQNGVVAQAIQTVEAEGVTYITAAGNNASNAYQAAWTPISGSYGGISLADAESFGGSLVQTITINTEGTGDGVPLLLEWNQAYGNATSDLEILVFNSSGTLVGTATNASSGEPTNPWAEFDFTQTGTYEVAIENLSGADPGLIKEIAEGDGLPVTISGANIGTVFGHAMTPGVITAGAVSTADTPAFGVDPAVSEDFSSSGAGTELLFADNGMPLSSPDMLDPVAVSGLDDIETTVSDLTDFYGTSAATASLAGVAALLLSANPNLTPAEVEAIMEETALPMADSAVSGSGLVQVDPAIAAAISVEAPPAAVLFQNVMTGQVYEWQVNGTSIIGSGFVGNNTDPGWQVVGIGDFNDNGYSDILLQNINSGQVYEWQMNGTSIIGSIVGNNTDPTWHVVGTGDFNDNGYSDILFQNINSGQVYEWEMNGTSLVGGGTVGNNTDPTWHVVGTGDFSDNGYSDILFQNFNTGQVYEWQMNGTTVIASGIVGNNTDPAWHVVGTGDFTGNGYSDILFQNANTGQVYEWEMNGTSVIASGIVGNNTDPAWQVVGTSDLNGDGKSDIIFQNVNTGQVFAWLMNGTSVIGSGVIGNNTNPTWHVAA